MKKIIILVMSFFILNTAWADRFLDLLSFKAHPQLDQVYNQISISVEDLNNSINGNYSGSYHYSTGEKLYKVELVNDLPGGNVISLKPVIEGDQAYIRVLVTPDGLKSAGALDELSRYLAVLNEKQNSYAHWFELVTNARMQSPVALQGLLELRAFSASYSPNNYQVIATHNVGQGFDLNPYASYFNEEYSQSLKLQFADITSNAKKELKRRQDAFTSRKVIFDQLDVSKDQLKDLVAKNDRTGVAKLVEAYIPWELLEPVEAQYWRNWIEVIKNPVPIEERVFVLRGLEKGGFFVNQADEMYLLSPVFINNQGTYNRRLRSLSTMLNKEISLNPGLIHDEPKILKNATQSSRVSNQFYNHAEDPMGSPHISFTKNTSTAAQFSDGKIGIFAIDPRLMKPNHVSAFMGELEIISSLVTFPDENVGFLLKEEISHLTYNQREVHKIIEATISNKLGQAKSKEIIQREFSDANPLASQSDFSYEANKRFYRWLELTQNTSCSVLLSP